VDQLRKDYVSAPAALHARWREALLLVRDDLAFLFTASTSTKSRPFHLNMWENLDDIFRNMARPKVNVP
jgi:hypothetical protein